MPIAGDEQSVRWTEGAQLNSGFLTGISLSSYLHYFIQHLYAFFHHAGGFGLLLIGVLDSSFLFMPLGNDLLLLALCAQDHLKLPYYAAMATAGSVLGTLPVDHVSRKGGEFVLEKQLSAGKLQWVRNKTKGGAGVALAVASLMPPPFPFTAFIVVASGLQYPRKKLLTIIAIFRYFRFSIEGVLGMVFGRQILRLGSTRWVEVAVAVLVVVAAGGSTLSVLRWLRAKKTAEFENS